MKPQAAFGNKTRSTFGDERHKMGLHAESEAFLVKLLTDLYTDPKGAVIREYSVNARDSVVDAGKNSPIIVTLPDSLDNPQFTVTDHGQGLTMIEVTELFGLYGNSTKRNSNDVTGMLGVGCKSGLTYANAFVVESVKDGEKTVIHFTRDEDDSPSYSVLSHETGVNEENHTTVSVPVNRHDIEEFHRYANWFFSFWQPGTVLVNGVAPTPIWHDSRWTRVGEMDAYVGPDYAEQVIVMGNVPYKVNHEIISATLSNNGFVAFVPMGSVSFAPSREELTYNKPTLRALKEVMDNLRKHAQTLVNDALTQAKSMKEAFAIRSTFDGQDVFTKNVKWEWNGQPVPTPPHRLTEIDSDLLRSIDYRSYDGNPMETYGRASSGNYVGGAPFIIIDGYKAKSVAKNHKIGIGKLIDDGTIPAPRIQQRTWNSQQLSTATVVLYNGDISDTTYDYLPSIEWDSIKDKMPKAKSSKGSGIKVDRNSHNYQLVGTTYRGWEYKQSFVPDIIKDEPDAKFFMVSPRPTDSEQNRMKLAIGLGIHPVIVYAASRKEFVKEYNVVDTAGITEIIREKTKGLDEDAFTLYHMLVDNSFFGAWRQHGQPEILDPRIATACARIVELDADLKVLAGMNDYARNEAFVLRGLSHKRNNLTGILGSDTLVRQVDKDYPLTEFGYYGHYNSKDVQNHVTYINALYTYRQEGN